MGVSFPWRLLFLRQPSHRWSWSLMKRLCGVDFGFYCFINVYTHGVELISDSMPLISLYLSSMSDSLKPRRSFQYIVDAITSISYSQHWVT